MESDIKTFRFQTLIAVALMLFGFGLATQLRSREQLSERLTAQSEPDLVEIIDSLDGEIKAIRTDLTDQQIRLEGFRDNEAGNQALINRTGGEIADLKLLLGREAAQGPGIVIQIKDRRRLLTGFDLRQIIEEIRASGGWAISVNGRRIDERTSLWRDAGYVYVDGLKMRSDFKIEAVGDGALLYQAITLPRGIRDKLDTLKGVSVSVRREKSLRLPAISLAGQKVRQ